MKNLDTQILYISLLLGSIVWGQPTLQPPTLHACPNETVTYSCHDTQVYEISWIVEPYIPESHPIKYTAELAAEGVGREPMNRADLFFANLTEVTRLSGSVADMTLSLTIITRGIENETVLTCRTVKGPVEYSFTTLYIAGVPYWKHDNITYQTQETYFTAVLELGDMFGGGGVPIDHYIIQVDNDTELETTGPTHSFNISYHTTLLVNISAHNCAGYSDLVMLEVHYDQESDCMECDTHGSSAIPVAVSVTIGVVITTITVILGLLSFYKLFQRCIKSRKDPNTKSVIKCDLSSNPAYEVHTCGAHITGHEARGAVPEEEYSMEDNPLYSITSCVGDLRQTETHYEYETVETKC